MSDSNSIVVIGRQYGSGGRAVGRAVAARLGVPYYDRELLSAAAERLGFRQDVFAMADEKRPSALRSLLGFSYGVTDSFGLSALSPETLYQRQSEVIRAIASEGGAVFVGRTADYVLRDLPRLLSVFIHAPEQHRVANIIARHEVESEKEAIEIAHRNDRRREEYYNYFTGRRWGVASNYHLCIDASRIDVDRAADIIASLSAVD